MNLLYNVTLGRKWAVYTHLGIPVYSLYYVLILYLKFQWATSFPGSENYFFVACFQKACLEDDFQ